MTIYFAYGSNLDAVNWAEFCRRHNADPGCMKPIGPAMLPDCELVFNYRSVLRAGGALNIRERKGHFVHGALFEVDQRGWEVLDLKESVAAGCYRRISHMAITAGGRAVPVTTYQVTERRIEGFVPPSDEYEQIVRRGLAAFGLPADPFEKAARNERVAAAATGVFVYGTLMQGESRHGAIQKHAPHETRPARVRGRLHATAADYPMLDLEAHEVGDFVHGEFVRFSDTGSVLETLDEIEVFSGYADAGNEYVRTLVEVEAGKAVMEPFALKATALYAGSLALWFLVLSYRVVNRRRAGIHIGDGGDPGMLRVVRGHANFAEYVPLALVMLAILELGGTSPYILHGLGLALLGGRLLHGYALSFTQQFGFGRFWGTLLTFAVLAVEAVLCLLLAVVP